MPGSAGRFKILPGLMFCVVFLSPSDSAVKQILVTLDERPGQSFIIEDLDEFHVLVRADEEQRVRRELEAQVCPFSSTYTQPFPLFLNGDARSWRRIRIAWKLSRQNVVVDARQRIYGATGTVSTPLLPPMIPQYNAYLCVIFVSDYCI
jgi:TFIIH basal transcription factor complex TTD-A subunit